MAPAGAFSNFTMAPGGASTWIHVISGRKVRSCLGLSLVAAPVCRKGQQCCHSEKVVGLDCFEIVRSLAWIIMQCLQSSSGGADLHFVVSRCSS